MVEKGKGETGKSAYIKLLYAVEIELTGVTREQVVGVLENLFETKAEPFESAVTENPYTYYKVQDSTGGHWTVMRDRSIRSEIYAYNKPPGVRLEGIELTEKGTYSVDLDEYKVEVVSPVLTYETLPILYDVVDAVGGLGGIVNETTGLHIHVDAPESAYDLLNILQRFCIVQNEVVSLFGSAGFRTDQYCKLYPTYAVNAFMGYDSSRAFLQIRDVYELYVEQLCVNPTLERPQPERYYALNLASLPKYGTIEFRYFNSTLDKDEIARILDWVTGFCYHPEPSGIAL